MNFKLTKFLFALGFLSTVSSSTQAEAPNRQKIYIKVCQAIVDLMQYQQYDQTLLFKDLHQQFPEIVDSNQLWNKCGLNLQSSDNITNLIDFVIQQIYHSRNQKHKRLERIKFYKERNRSDHYQPSRYSPSPKAYQPVKTFRSKRATHKRNKNRRRKKKR